MVGYDETRGREAHRAVIERVRSIPGVEAAAFASTVPFGEFHEGMPVEAVGMPKPAADGAVRRLTALSAPTTSGRWACAWCADASSPASKRISTTAPRVAIVDEITARQLFPDRDPLGQMIRVVRRDREAGSGNDGEPMEIVGIAPPMRDTLFDKAAVAHLYVPSGRHYRAGMNLHVRVQDASAAAENAALAGHAPGSRAPRGRGFRCSN